MTGAISEAYYGIPADIRNYAFTFLDNDLVTIINEFESKYGITLEKETSSFTRSVAYKSLN